MSVCVRVRACVCVRQRQRDKERDASCVNSVTKCCALMYNKNR